MKLKKISQVILLACSLIWLSGCSSAGTSADDQSAISDVNDGALSSGAGTGNGFGDENDGSLPLAAKRTYYFEFDRSEVQESDKPAILANADYLIAHPEIKVIVEGHTDPRGSREYNVALGERRANTVAELLRARGVNNDQIRVVSYGAQKLAAGGHSEEDYRLDRRAVLIAQK